MSGSAENEILLHDDQIWVTFRGTRFGPFGYQWSNDLHGMEFLYQGCKFGEVCSDEEIFADLQPFGLPLSVCQVATLTVGTIIEGIRAGSCVDERVSRLIALLVEFGFDRFQIREIRSL